MAVYGAKSPVFAPFAEPENGTEPIKYGAGQAVGKLVSCGVTPNAAEGSLYADNVLAEYVREPTDTSITLETDDMAIDRAAMLFGATIVGNDLVYRQTDNSPLGGYAFYHTAMRDGFKYHIGHFFPKVRASRNAKTFTTKGSSITFGTASVAMKAMFTNAGDIEFESEPFTNEADAYGWCAAKLGIGNYHRIDVSATGETAEKYVDRVGASFVPAGNGYELLIVGTPKAAYDNGQDVSASISGGKYTLSAVEADHEIVIIF